MKNRLYKVLSIILSITLLLSVCFVAGVVNASATEKITDYYVGYSENPGKGTSLDDLAPSVQVALETMNENGLGAGDEANIWIVQHITGIKATSATAHNVVYWGDPVDHSAKVYIKAHKDNTFTGSVQKTLVSTGQKFGSQPTLVPGGPTVFEDVCILFPYGSSPYLRLPINLNGAPDTTFSENTTFEYITGINSASYSSWTSGIPEDLYSLVSEVSLLPIYVDYGSNAQTHTEPVKVAINKGYNTVTHNCAFVVIGDSNDTFKENVTVEFDLPGSGNPRAQIGYNGSGGAVYEKNLNFKVKEASLFKFNPNIDVTVKGGVHLITAAGVTYNGDHTITDIAVDANKDPAKTWILNVPDVQIDRIDFHGETGKFQVPEGAVATATYKADGSTYESDANGVLDLSSKTGEYDVNIIQVKSKVYEYYVQQGGTGDGTSIDNPAPDVATVLSYVNDCRLTADETATVYIIQDIDKPTLTGAADSVGSLAPHNMAAWGGKTTHEGKVIIKPHPSNAANYNDVVTTTYLAGSALAGDSSGYIELGGPVEFQDVMLVYTYGTYGGHVINDKNVIKANGNDLTIGEGVTYGNIHSTSATEGAWGESGQIDTYTMFGVSAAAAGSINSDSVRLTFDGAMSYNAARIDVPGIDAGTYTFNKDVTLDFEGDQYGTSVRFGSLSASTTTIAKNLNLKFAHGRILRVFNGAGTINVGGAYQVIESTDCSYQMSGNSYDPIDDITVVKGADGNAPTTYRLTVNADYIDYIDFVEGEAGKFAITHPDLIAVATDAEGNETPSVNGVLDLSAAAGEYTVDFVDAYTNNGQQISVYKDVTIDLSTVTHTETVGYAFIGWKLKNADGSLSEVASPAKLTLGDVLVAQYLELGTDFAIEETAQIRDDGEEGKGTLRFVINRNNDFYDLVPNASEFGTILFATDATRGNEIYYDENVILEWIYDETQEGLYGSHFVPGVGGSSSDKYQTEYKPVVVMADNILEETETDLKYTACITGIPQEDYYTWYTARGFIKFTDYNGIDRILYTEQSQSCMYKVAAETDAAELTDAEQAVIDYIDNYHTVAAYDEMYEKTYTYGVDADGSVTDPNRIIYKQNGLYVRDVEIDIDTLGDGATPYEVCFITDSHFNVLSTNDILNGSNYILGSYRGRYYYTYRRAYIVKQLAYASRFDKVVFGGDQFDYLSDGNLTSVNRMITKKSINGSISMVLGNHESAEFCAPVDVANAYEKRTLEDKYAEIQNYWATDTYIENEIIKDESGNAIAMFVYLDNSDEEYWQIQLDTLPEYFAEAREAGIPVFIYQHIPMLTMNPDETAVWYSGHEGSFATSADDSKNGEVIDYNTYEGFLGSDEDTQVTKDVCTLIRKNADIIKGIFCGHTHENAYTELVGLNQDGTTNDLRIPQHNGFAAHRHGVMKITLN